MKFPMTLERKLTLILFSFFLSVLCVMVLLLARLQNEYEERVYVISGDNTAYLLSSSDSVFSGAQLLSDIFVADGFYQQSLSALKDGEREENAEMLKADIVSHISAMLDTSPFIIDIALMTQKGILRAGAGFSLSSEAVDEASALARAANGASVWVGSEDESIYLARSIRRLEFLSLDELAVLFIRLDARAVAQALRGEEENAGLRLLFSSDGRLLYSEFPDRNEIPSLDETSSSIDGEECFIYHGTLPSSGFAYTVALPVESLYSDIYELVFAAFLLLMAMFAAFLLILHHIVKRMLLRLGALRRKMDAFASGSSSESIVTLPGNDEIAQLNDRFDSMAKGYKEVVEDNYRREIMLKDSAIKMLTQQINPHFLYNVLDSIYWMSQKYEADDIASMSYDLASLFRAAVSSEDLVTVRKELEMLESFLRIQRSRFADQISYTANTDECALDALIPKFSLQPLVENAVKHSVEESGTKTEITVTCSKEDDVVLLEVANTGSAFPPDMDIRLKEGKASKSTERIGLQNIDERLHLLFGEEFGLIFRNEDGKAIVSFIVPWRYDAEGNTGR